MAQKSSWAFSAISFQLRSCVSEAVSAERIRFYPRSQKRDLGHPGFTDNGVMSSWKGRNHESDVIHCNVGAAAVPGCVRAGPDSETRSRETGCAIMVGFGGPRRLWTKLAGGSIFLPVENIEGRLGEGASASARAAWSRRQSNAVGVAVSNRSSRCAEGRIRHHPIQS